MNSLLAAADGWLGGLSTQLLLNHNSSNNPFVPDLHPGEGQPRVGSDTPRTTGKLPEHQQRGDLTRLDLFHQSFNI